MYFSTKNLSLDEKFKSAPRTYIKTFLIPNFFCKKRLFYVSKAPQAQRVMGALSYTQKLLKMIFTFLGIFFAPPNSKNKCLNVGFTTYTKPSKNDNFCHFMMDFEKLLIFL